MYNNINRIFVVQKLLAIMKTIYTLFVAVLLSCACVSCDGIFNSSPKETVVGGYSEAHKLSAEERALFDSVAAEVAGVKYTPINVSTQIVAGVNYRFLCKGKEQERGGKKFYAVIVVYQPLPNAGEPRIISIERQSR